jgi:hypothetical protein
MKMRGMKKLLVLSLALLVFYACTKDKGSLPAKQRGSNQWKGYTGSYYCIDSSTNSHYDWHVPMATVSVTNSIMVDTLVIDTALGDPNDMVLFANTSRPLIVHMNSDSTFYSNPQFYYSATGRFFQNDSITVKVKEEVPYDHKSTRMYGHK